MASELRRDRNLAENQDIGSIIDHCHNHEHGHDPDHHHIFTSTEDEGFDSRPSVNKKRCIDDLQHTHSHSHEVFNTVNSISKSSLQSIYLIYVLCVMI